MYYLLGSVLLGALLTLLAVNRWRAAAAPQPQNLFSNYEVFLNGILDRAPLLLFVVDRRGDFVLARGKGLEAIGMRAEQRWCRSGTRVPPTRPAGAQQVMPPQSISP